MQDRYSKNIIQSLCPQRALTQTECQSIINNTLLQSSNKKLKQVWLSNMFIRKYNLEPFLCSILYYTHSFDNISMVERVYRVFYQDYSQHKCLLCNQGAVTFDKFTKGFRKFCSARCNATYNAPSKHRSEETKEEVRAKLSQKFKGRSITKEWRDKLKKAAQKDNVKRKKQNTCLERYGTSNPGVLGAFSSLSAKQSILSLIESKKIDIKSCMFKSNELQTHEFWQMISIPFLGKKRYFSYDLVVFESEDSKNKRDTSQIDFVFEYNGPWHYREQDILIDPDGPATPYKNNKFSRKQVYIMDTLKIAHILQCGAKKVIVYWEKHNILEEYYLFSGQVMKKEIDTKQSMSEVSPLTP